jgi:pro-kumamolisin-like protein/Big-like domain-containing protein
MGTQVTETMRPQPASFIRILLLFAFFSLLLPLRTLAQASPVPSRVTQAVDESNLTILKGNTYYLARAEYDRGAAPPSLPMNRMLLVLLRSPSQEAALEQLLDQQQDLASPNYHQWLTPQQFGQQFGPSDQDIQTITTWLQSHGFQVAPISNGRTIIEFSGTAAQVQEAFHTAIHKYSVPNATGALEDHWANSTDPSIPTTLTPVIVGIDTLHNFLKQPQHALSQDKFRVERDREPQPEFTGTNGTGTVHAVGPGDLAVIYNANPLYTASPSINGSGSTVAVVARSDYNLVDLSQFRSNFGVVSPPIQILVNGTDPGDLGGDEEVEATLDASYATALAQQADENFVVSASTNTTDGVDLSEIYIIDNNLGDVMTESFGSCEEGATASQSANISNLAQQAAAQGITYLVSSGDNGSAACDAPTNTVATQGVSVNILASSPYTVAVGGTMFNEGANPSTYWNSSDSSTLTSAKSYIPEDVWNQSCSVASCGTQDANLFASSGGVSIIFPLPAWQSGVAGIPTSPAFRNLPDVSLTAAGHDPYLICLEGACVQGEFSGVFGTSASVQAFGGIMALVRQKIGARVGQADYVFYKLAATETLANCNGSQAAPVPNTNCIFYDTTLGNNIVPGITNGDYTSTVGYDRTTGLGSVNITNLVNKWSSVTFAPSVTTLSVNPTTFIHGTTANISITVAPQTGTPSFNSEEVSLVTSAGNVLNDFTLSSTGTAATSINNLTGGSYSLTAHYPGDGTLGSSSSPAVNLVISPETSTTVAAALSGPPADVPFTSSTYGTPTFLSGTVTGQSGVGTPTGTLSFTADGVADGNATLNSSGTGTTSSAIPALAVGSHTVSASYPGDANFKSSTSAGVNLSITKGPTTILLQLPTTAGVTTTITASVTVNTTSNGNAPTGTVTLLSGSTQIGGAALAPFGIGTNGFVISNTSIPVQVSQLGPLTLTAQYAGDSNYTGVTSSPVTVDALRTTTTTVTTSSPSVQTGQNVTFTAQIVSGQSGGPAIGGSVTFYVDGGSPLGSPVTVTNGQAQLVNPFLPSGTNGLSAFYNGDTNYEGSASPSIPFTVTAGPDFTVSFAPATLNVSAPGASAATTVAVAGSNNYNGVINFSAASCSGLPSESSCSFSPASVTGSGTTTLTVSTTAPSSLVPLSRHIDFGGWRTTTAAIRFLLFAVALFALAIQARRRRWNLFATGLTLTLLIAVAACGGGGSGSGGTGPTNPGTPVVTNQIVTVTATSGTTTHTFTFTLNVN